MTLFRKVFQNQSRPATGDEALDEDALRDVFIMAEDERAMPLDPFALLSERDVAVDPVEDVPEAEEAFADSVPDDVVAEADAETDTDVAAELDMDEPEAPEGADIAAVLAQTRIMEEVPVPSEPAAGPEEDPLETQAEEETSALEDPPEISTEDHTAEAPADASDVVAYARQQLQLSEGIAQPETSPEPEPVDLSDTDQLSGGAAPAAGRAGRRTGRVKTRLLGFNRPEADGNDPIGTPENATAKPQHDKFPVGWLVVVEGPGIGHSFSIFTGASMIGRGEDQVIKLDFGDNSISRHNHAAIAYDEEQNKFYLGHGGKSNIIRRNARPVLSTEELQHADLIRIGETTLRFVALCGSDFQWDMTEGGDAPDL